MMPTFPSSPLKFRTASFPRYGFKAGFQMTPSCWSTEFTCSTSLRSPFVLAVASSLSALCRSHWYGSSTALRAVYTALPQRPSLQFGFCCPDPSSLIRPPPPHLQAQRDFTALQLIRSALAVRFRLGDPQVVPCFRCSFFPDMSSSTTPGSSVAAYTQFLRYRRWPSPVY